MASPPSVAGSSWSSTSDSRTAKLVGYSARLWRVQVLQVLDRSLKNTHCHRVLSFSYELYPMVILEGTRLTGKTDIAFALNEHPRIVGPRRYRYRSPLVSAEWCGFTNVPWGRGLINFEPQEEARALEAYGTSVRLLKFLRYYSWIVDRSRFPRSRTSSFTTASATTSAVESGGSMR